MIKSLMKFATMKHLGNIDIEKFERKLISKQKKCSELLHYISRMTTIRNELLLRQVELNYKIIRHGHTQETEETDRNITQELFYLDRRLWRTQEEAYKAEKNCKRFRRSFWRKFESYSNSNNEMKYGRMWCRYMTGKLLSKWSVIKERDRFLKAEKDLFEQLAKHERTQLNERKTELLQTVAEEMPEYQEEIEYLMDNLGV